MGAEPPWSSSSAPVRSSDRRQWQRIFQAMVDALQAQKSQIETLVGDRKLLQDYIHAQHDRFVSKIRLLESQICQMKKAEDIGRRVQEAKLNLMLGLKQREVLGYKDQLERSESDLEDFHECVATLCWQISGPKVGEKESKEAGRGMREGDSSKNVEGEKEDEQRIPMLEKELRKWKHAYKRLGSKNEREVSALLAEKDFVWSQFKKMESDHTSLLKSKRIEVEQANEAVEKLQVNIEKLQSSALEKDETIVKLKDDLVRLELELRLQHREVQQSTEKLEHLQLGMEKLQSSAKEKDETIANLRSDLMKLEMSMSRRSNGKSRLSKELGSLTKSKDCSVTAAGRHPKVASGRAVSRSGSSPVVQKRFHVYNDSSGSQTSDTRLRQCSKRKKPAAAACSTLENPKLFSSNFKVPKLKNSPTRV